MRLITLIHNTNDTNKTNNYNNTNNTSNTNNTIIIFLVKFPSLHYEGLHQGKKYYYNSN